MPYREGRIWDLVKQKYESRQEHLPAEGGLSR